MTKFKVSVTTDGDVVALHNLETLDLVNYGWLVSELARAIPNDIYFYSADTPKPLFTVNGEYVVQMARRIAEILRKLGKIEPLGEVSS